MKSICVFCGSSLGSDSKFKEAAYSVGKTLAENNITLVYGGANVGLMGVTADAALENGGKVIGVLPEFLESKEIAHTHLFCLTNWLPVFGVKFSGEVTT